MSCQTRVLWWISVELHRAAADQPAFSPPFFLLIRLLPDSLCSITEGFICLFFFSLLRCRWEIYPRASCRPFTILRALQASPALKDSRCCPHEGAHLFLARPLHLRSLCSTCLHMSSPYSSEVKRSTRAPLSSKPSENELRLYRCLSTPGEDVRRNEQIWTLFSHKVFLLKRPAAGWPSQMTSEDILGQPWFLTSVLDGHQ